MLEQLLNEMKVIKHENEEMKQQGAFHFWRKRCDDMRDEMREAEQWLRDARKIAREEREMYEEEEDARRRVKTPIDRLRRERNEWRDFHDELIAGWTEEENAEKEHKSRSTISEAAVSAVGYSSSKISRKEADKITIPNWPKIHELEFWKSQVTSNIVAASDSMDCTNI